MRRQPTIHADAASLFASTDTFRRLAEARLLPAVPESFHAPATRAFAAPSDFDLNPNATPPSDPPRPAAVLVGLVPRDELHVLLTLRTSHLPKHAGQIAFPGGKVDAEDATPLATALREAEEEIGLDPALVEPLGYLDPYRTGTGFLVLPVVAFVAPRYTSRLNADEVAELFEVPLSFLMDETNHQRHSRMYSGVERFFHAMPFGERFIWGATAGMLKNMHTRLFAP